MPPEAATSVSANNTPVAANAPTWADSFDADTKQWVSGKGWDKLEPAAVLPELVKGYRGAESKLGISPDQLLRLPGKDAKPEEWNPVWARLGAPEKPEEYGLAEPGKETEFLKTASGWFHEMRMPKQMAAGLAAKWNQYVGAQQEAEVGKWNQRFDTEVTELKNEWKADYDKHLDLSNRVLRAAGFTPEQQMAIERALGPKAFRLAFAKFGGMVGEHRFVGGENQGQNFGMSAEGAKQRIAALQADPAWQKKYLNGDADAKAEFTRLQEVAHGTAQVT
jgi:hypothetical protein